MVINDILSVQTNHKNKSQPKFPRALTALRKKKKIEKQESVSRPGLTSGPSEASSAEGVLEQTQGAAAGSPPVLGRETWVSSESVSMWKAHFFPTPIQFFFRLFQRATAALGNDASRPTGCWAPRCRMTGGRRPPFGGQGLSLQEVRDRQAQAAVQDAGPRLQRFARGLLQLPLAQVDQQRPGPLL